jgi:hypothetical protein
MCLCNCDCILAVICPKVNNIFIMGPLDVNESNYKEFDICIQR